MDISSLVAAQVADRPTRRGVGPGEEDDYYRQGSGLTFAGLARLRSTFQSVMGDFGARPTAGVRCDGTCGSLERDTARLGAG